MRAGGCRRSQALVVWWERSSFPQVWGWPGREQICLMPRRAQHAFEVGCAVRASRPVKQLPLSFMTRAGRPHSCTALVKASQATLAVGPVSTRAATRAREWSSRMSMIHTRVPIGERPGGGVDLPGVVGSWPLEASPRGMGTLARLRGRPCPGAPAPGESWQPREPIGHRAVRGGRRWPARRSRPAVPCAAGRSRPRSRPRSAAARVRAPRPLHQPGGPFGFEPPPILVERLARDPELAAQRRHVDRHSAGEHRQQLRFHRHHLLRHAPRHLAPTGVSDVPQQDCQRSQERQQQSVATRQQREHQWPSAPIFSEGKPI